jgi:tryptophan halogenase
MNENSSSSEKKIVVLGGGTAGWLSAFLLQDFCRQHQLSAKVTVIESSKIPVIGVGEGTTAIFKTFLDSFGLEETEFLRETRGTIKYGIRHKDWRKLGHHYDGPIDDPHFLIPPAGEDGFEYLNSYCVAAGRSVSEAHLFQILLSKGLAPVKPQKDQLVPNHPFLHAYHIDNALVGKYLLKKSKGIRIVDGVVEEALRDSETGHIQSLKMDDGDQIEGDFFIDCSGFRRILIDKTLGNEWVDYSAELPVNRAMPFFLDHDKSKEIPSYTLAWAQKSGWMWQIPTQDRLGCGYVYCDQFCSPEEAQGEIESVLGHSIEPRQDLRFQVGRLKDSWRSNCVAVGLSAGFLEPLEATSIHSTLVQLILFAKKYLSAALNGDYSGRADFNQRIAHQFDDFRTFLNIHYRSERRDTPFWEFVQKECLGNDSKELLEKWRQSLPMRQDFEPFLSGLPHVETQLYFPVLDGLGLLSQGIARQEMSNRNLKRQAQEELKQLHSKYLEMTQGSLGHREYLLKVSA